MQLYAFPRITHLISLRCDRRDAEQVLRSSHHLLLKFVEWFFAITAYLMRTLRYQRHHDLPCHVLMMGLAFYYRLLPRQPRATPKPKINGGLCARRLLRSGHPHGTHRI
jgi:hypothetical protein